MPRTFTLTQLITKVRQRSDTEGSRHVSDAEITDYLNTAYAELYELLVDAGEHYFEKAQAITTAGSGTATGTIALPSDHFETLRVDYQPDGQTLIPIPAIMATELDMFFATGGVALAHRVVGSNLVLYPAPPAGQNYQHLYIPTCPLLVNPGDTLDGVNGWEELVVVGAAILVMAKEETDASLLLAKQAELRKRIAVMAANRELLSVGRVTDVGEPTLMRDQGDWRIGRWNP